MDRAFLFVQVVGLLIFCSALASNPSNQDPNEAETKEPVVHTLKTKKETKYELSSVDSVSIIHWIVDTPLKLAIVDVGISTTYGPRYWAFLVWKLPHPELEKTISIKVGGFFDRPKLVSVGEHQFALRGEFVEIEEEVVDPGLPQDGMGTITVDYSKLFDDLRTFNARLTLAMSGENIEEQNEIYKLSHIDSEISLTRVRDKKD